MRLVYPRLRGRRIPHHVNMTRIHICKRKFTAHRTSRPSHDVTELLVFRAKDTAVTFYGCDHPSRAHNRCPAKFSPKAPDGGRRFDQNIACFSVITSGRGFHSHLPLLIEHRHKRHGKLLGDQVLELEHHLSNFYDTTDLGLVKHGERKWSTRCRWKIQWLHPKKTIRSLLLS